MTIDRPRASRAIRELLAALGIDTEQAAELLGTPDRVAETWAEELLDGYGMDPKAILEPVAAEAGDVVAVTGLAFHGICAHHLLPFHGQAHVAYRPSGLLAGLSCLGRLVDCFAHRLTLQERVATQVTTALTEHLGAVGAACVLEGRHTCMIARGSRQAGARVLSSSFVGTMIDGPDRALVTAAIGKPTELGETDG